MIQFKVIQFQIIQFEIIQFEIILFDTFFKIEYEGFVPCSDGTIGLKLESDF